MSAGPLCLRPVSSGVQAGLGSIPCCDLTWPSTQVGMTRAVALKSARQ